MDLSFFHDQAGEPRASCAPPYDLLGHFLESDIQGNRTVCQDILQILDRVAAGELQVWQQTGNAHTLVLTADGAYITADFDPAARPCHMALAEFRSALERWCAFLAG